MDQASRDNLQNADRNSGVVHIRFDDGSVVAARIREIDWERHHCVTYLDMDSACRAVTADLDSIESVTPAKD